MLYCLFYSAITFNIGVRGFIRSIFRSLGSKNLLGMLKTILRHIDLDPINNTIGRLQISQPRIGLLSGNMPLLKQTDHDIRFYFRRDIGQKNPPVHSFLTPFCQYYLPQHGANSSL
ncbi:hypothetical protein HMPREF0322_02161 [Desulfitobacterium hafniense DP7]|uniref:Uncharacterized protein n=2 Tax=Desulfitobacterium hafniense TaxID=49338 RepID=Q24WY6_DESHY|nr:hypothetical protein HMPREF0322_02161 [Desulfitobacterium hafniense DP7]BAE83456.1 hypothetical protein DSY1667 [Desulfitobacterium hafniense Y51]